MSLGTDALGGNLARTQVAMNALQTSISQLWEVSDSPVDFIKDRSLEYLLYDDGKRLKVAAILIILDGWGKTVDEHYSDT